MCPLGNDHDVPRWLTTNTSPSALTTTPPALRVFLIQSSLSTAKVSAQTRDVPE
jgi:hypothetical protein